MAQLLVLVVELMLLHAVSQQVEDPLLFQLVFQDMLPMVPLLAALVDKELQLVQLQLVLALLLVLLAKLVDGLLRQIIVLVLLAQLVLLHATMFHLEDPQ